MDIRVKQKKETNYESFSDFIRTSQYKLAQKRKKSVEDCSCDFDLDIATARLYDKISETVVRQFDP